MVSDGGSVVQSNDVLFYKLFVLQTFTPALCDDVGVYSHNIQAMEEYWKPCTKAPEIWSIVGNELIRFVHTKHPMIVVIYHLWYFDVNFPVISPHLLDMVLVGGCYSW